MRTMKSRWLAIALVIGFFAVPASALAQQGGIDESVAEEEGETDEGEKESSSEKNWKVQGSLESTVGQGTFASLENDTGTPGERKPNRTAYDRVSMIYTLAPSYKFKEFTFGAEFQLVQWLTPGGGVSGIPAIGGANDPGDVYFQDISLSGAWKGYTVESIGLNIAPSLSVNLPTSKMSRLSTKILDTGLSVALSKNFFERLTLVGNLSGSKYFHRFKTPAVDLDRVGADNVLFRPDGAENLGDGLVSVGGYNTSAAFAAGGAAKVKIIPDLSFSASYTFINFYSYPGPDRDEFSSKNSQPGTNVGQVVSTGAELSYKINEYVSVNSGIGSYMSPKTSDNKSVRFPFWNTQGAAANYSWLKAGVTGSY